jgi:transposase
VSAETGQYKTVKEIAAKFKVSHSTVYRMCNLEGPGRWPCGRVGAGSNARIRFSPEHEAAIALLIERGTSGPGLPAAPGIDPATLRRVAKKLLPPKPRRQGLAA